MNARPWLQFYDQAVANTLVYDERLVSSLIDDPVRTCPRRTALNFLGFTMSYQDLAEAVGQCARALAGIGVTPRERVVLLLPNCPHFVIACYAALSIGAVVVPTNPLYSEKELAFQISDSGAETLITLDRLYSRVQAVRPETALRRIIVGRIQDFLPPLKKIMYPILGQKGTGNLDGDEKSGVFRYAPLVQRRFPPVAAPDIRCEDLAMLQYTGGTTGVAKGAMLTHRNIVANHAQIRTWYRDLRDGEEVFISVLPFFHSYGMATTMNLPLSIGATMIMFPAFSAKDVLKGIRQHCATVFPGIPSIYSALCVYRGIQTCDISTINYCISGAAPLPVAVLQHFEALTGGSIIEGYGLSEASPVTHCNPMKGRRKIGSIGLPLPDTDCRVVDVETGQDVPRGEPGELWIRGPQVMQGYWNNASETDQTMRDGWLLTGDIARMDEEGYFFIVERKKDMIISDGFNIYPREIEECLTAHPSVADAAVVGIPDRLRGERSVACVVRSDSVTAQELTEYCRQRLAKYKVPRKIIFTEAIPTTIAGKKLRRLLRDKAVAQADTTEPAHDREA